MRLSSLIGKKIVSAITPTPTTLHTSRFLFFCGLVSRMISTVSPLVVQKNSTRRKGLTNSRFERNQIELEVIQCIQVQLVRRCHGRLRIHELQQARRA